MRKKPLQPAEQEKFADRAEKVSLNEGQALHTDAPRPISIEGMPDVSDQAHDESLSRALSGRVRPGDGDG